MKNLFLLKFVILSLIFSSCEEEEEMVINTATARVQVIHNSADLAAASVDIYLNNTLLIDDFNFRTASPFIDAPAGEEITISEGNNLDLCDGSTGGCEVSVTLTKIGVGGEDDEIIANINAYADAN